MHGDPEHRGETPTGDAPTAAAAATDDNQIPPLFETQVRPALRGMAKAIYMGAHVGSMSDGALVISFAGEPHRVRAEEYRRDVEKALAAAAGRSVPLSLVVDQGTATDDNVVQLKRASRPKPTKTSTPATWSTCRPTRSSRRSTG